MQAKKKLTPEPTVREAIAVFDNADSLQQALDDLEEAGFMRQELSVIADKNTIEKKLGKTYDRVENVASDYRTPRTIFVPNEVIGEAEGVAVGVPVYVAAVIATCAAAASGGTLGAVIAAAATAGATAGLLGLLLAQFISKHHADYIQEHIQRGGLLLWVNLRSALQERKAKEILAKRSNYDVHVHEIPLYD